MAIDSYPDELLAALGVPTGRGFAALTPEERSWRGRYFLMVWSLGATADFAWANALVVEPADAAAVRELVATTDDLAIIEAVLMRLREAFLPSPSA